MAKHNMFRTEFPPKPSKLPTHPIWRGIGLILMVILPIGSYFISSMLVDNKEKYSWLVIPQDIMLRNYPRDPYILVRVLYAFLILLIIWIVLAFFTFLSAKLFGPSRYDSYDVPPDKIMKR